jgi:2-polyprenyl-6-methoxyphenol hydroxylase-like FAD-dependent oxidoreductase
MTTKTVPGGPSRLKEHPVAVVGGGIGGLSAALSLLRAGFDVHVYEQASALGEVGAGVQVSPNASRILHRLGSRESWPGSESSRWRGTSAAGTTAARCCARPWPSRSRPPSASLITRSTAPTCWRRWRARSRPSASIWATAWSG